MSGSPNATDTSSHQRSIDTVTEAELTVILAEYNALRNEILKRIEFRYQLINFLLAGAAAFLTLGVEWQVSSALLLVYPILALFLAAGWAHNGITMLQAGQYIRDELEGKGIGFGWESFLKRQATQVKEWSPRFPIFGSLGTLSTSGLIMTTQLLALGLALLKFSATFIEIVLLCCSVVAILTTLVLLRYIRHVGQAYLGL